MNLSLAHWRPLSLAMGSTGTFPPLAAVSPIRSGWPLFLSLSSSRVDKDDFPKLSVSPPPRPMFSFRNWAFLPLPGTRFSCPPPKEPRAFFQVSGVTPGRTRSCDGFERWRFFHARAAPRCANQVADQGFFSALLLWRDVCSSQVFFFFSRNFFPSALFPAMNRVTVSARTFFYSDRRTPLAAGPIFKRTFFE